MNKNIGGNLCSVKASTVGFNLTFEPKRSSYPVGAIILKVGETMGSWPYPILNNLSKFQYCSARMNQHPPVHQLGVLSTAWGGISYLVPKSALTTVQFFLVLTITWVFFFCAST